LREFLLVAFWPVRFAWHASSIARLAHAPLVHYSLESIFLENAFPVAHALAAPDALELRRYAFGTSLACLVVAVALLLAWWRCLWYALGAVISEFFGLSAFDVASAELRLKKLKDTSLKRSSYVASVAAERRCWRFRLGGGFRNPYRGHVNDDDESWWQQWRRRRDDGGLLLKSRRGLTRRPRRRFFDSSPLLSARGKQSAWRVARGLKWRLATRLRDLEKRRLLSVTAELNRPLLRLLAAATAFVLSALVVVVVLRDRQTKWSYVFRATVIFAAAVRQDVLPVVLVVLKLCTVACAAVVRRALALISPVLFLGLLLTLASSPSSPSSLSSKKQQDLLRSSSSGAIGRRRSSSYSSSSSSQDDLLAAAVAAAAVGKRGQSSSSLAASPPPTAATTV